MTASLPTHNSVLQGEWESERQGLHVVRNKEEFNFHNSMEKLGGLWSKSIMNRLMRSMEEVR